MYISFSCSGIAIVDFGCSAVYYDGKATQSEKYGSIYISEFSARFRDFSRDEATPYITVGVSVRSQFAFSSFTAY